MAEDKIDQFVRLAVYADEIEFDPEAPEVSKVFLGMTLNAMTMELEQSGLLEAATDRLEDARKKVQEARDGGESAHTGDGETG